MKRWHLFKVGMNFQDFEDDMRHYESQGFHVFQFIPPTVFDPTILHVICWKEEPS